MNASSINSSTAISGPIFKILPILLVEALFNECARYSQTETNKNS